MLNNQLMHNILNAILKVYPNSTEYLFIIILLINMYFVLAKKKMCCKNQNLNTSLFGE